MLVASWLGTGNTIGRYGFLLVVYGALFIIMRYANPRIELNFRATFWVLAVGWGVGTFLANYALYRLGVMSFLPWLNNLLHTLVWIGLCLGFLYAGAHTHRWLEQFLIFAIFSCIVKIAEHQLLGTWELDHFFGINGNTAYIVGWSLMDGLYPTLSRLALRVLRPVIPGLLTP